MASPIDPEVALGIARQIASALAHAHASGVLHRDVKPSNILLDSAGNAYLADFGLAVLIDEAGAGGDGLEGRGGTPQYMAPEQARGDVAGPAADQFSLGRVVIEMLAGGRAPADADAAIATLPASIPRALVDVIRRAIDPDPDRRWPSVERFAAELDAIDVRAVPAARRLLPEVRIKTPFLWAASGVERGELAPGIARADYRLSELEAAGAITADAARAFRDATGYADFGWSVVGRTDRVGSIVDPAAYARAGELVVMMHGGLCTRQSWITVAAHVAQHNAQTACRRTRGGCRGAST
jgi:hypothetical protein